MNTTTNTIADRSEVRQAIRRVLQHHKLTKHGDGVVEADLAHAVVDAIAQQAAAKAPAAQAVPAPSIRTLEFVSLMNAWRNADILNAPAAYNAITAHIDAKLAASPASTPEASQQAAAGSTDISQRLRVALANCGSDARLGPLRADIEAAANALDQQAAAVAAPSGYVLVPELPTLEMQQAAMNAARTCVLEDGQPRPLPNGYELWSATFVYRAMIDAAPAPAAAATTSEDARDAARYRLLVEKFEQTTLPCFLERHLTHSYVADGKASIDAAIDSTMRATQQEGGK